MTDFDVRIDAGGSAWAMDSLHIWLRNNRGDVPSLLADGGRRIVVLHESMAPEPNDYFCTLPYEAASPLLGALSRHLGAVEHPEQLRRDFDHLRARHDLLVDHMLTSSDDNARAFRVLTEQWGRPRR